MPSTKMSLYDVSLEGKLIEELLTLYEGELTPELEERLDKLMTEGPQRIEAAAMVVRGLEATEAAIKDEETRLRERRLSFEKQANKLKERMVIACDSAFSGKVKTQLFTIWTQKAADSVEIALDEAFTIEHLEEDHPDLVKTVKSIDTTAVCQLLKQNEQSLTKAADIL